VRVGRVQAAHLQHTTQVLPWPHSAPSESGAS
jgi:hypothetical protein